MRAAISHKARSLLVTDLTSGVPLVAGVLLSSASLTVGFFATGRDTLPGWADPFNIILYACLYLAPACGASAAAHAGWVGRSGVLALAETAPDGKWRAMRLAACSTWIWSAASYAALIGVVLLTSDLSGPQSFSMLVLPLQGLVLVSVCVITGSVTGTRFTATWVPPLLGMLLFVILYVLDATTGPLQRFSVTYTGVAYRNNLVPNTALLIAVTLTLTGIGALVLAGPRARARRRAGLLLAGVGLVLTSSGAGLVHAAGPNDVQFRDGGAARCLTRQSVTLCVFSESSPQLAPMTAALAKATDAAAPLINVPHDFYQPDVATSQTDPIPVDIPPNDESGGQLVRAIGALVPGLDCPSERDDYVALTGLLFERLQPGVTGSSEMHDLATSPVSVQRAWLSPRMQRLAACS